MDFDGPLTNIEFNGNLSAHEPFGYELDDFSLSISQRSPSIRPKRTSHETFSSFAIYLQCIDDAGKKFFGSNRLHEIVNCPFLHSGDSGFNITESSHK